MTNSHTAIRTPRSRPGAEAVTFTAATRRPPPLGVRDPDRHRGGAAPSSPGVGIRRFRLAPARRAAAVPGRAPPAAGSRLPSVPAGSGRWLSQQGRNGQVGRQAVPAPALRDRRSGQASGCPEGRGRGRGRPLPRLPTVDRRPGRVRAQRGRPPRPAPAGHGRRSRGQRRACAPRARCHQRSRGIDISSRASTAASGDHARRRTAAVRTVENQTTRAGEHGRPQVHDQHARAGASGRCRAAGGAGACGRPRTGTGPPGSGGSPPSACRRTG